MSRESIIKGVIAHTIPEAKTPRTLALGLMVAGVVGLALGFGVAPSPMAGWAGLLTGTVLTIGIAMVGPVLSAIFQLTGAKWGRAYRRLAEASVVLMIPAFLGILALLAGGHSYLPWVLEHPHVGGKAIWLTRGFWDARVLGCLLVAYSVGLRFVYFSVRRDFCLVEIREHFKKPLSLFFARNIKDPTREAKILSAKLTFLAPIVVIVYGVAFTLLGFDLVMALEPNWFSTLFGAWYFVGNLFSGLALLAIATAFLRKRYQLQSYLTANRQSDMATLLLAFCLINVDFFWNQYLTIWYANLPEETGYLIERTVETGLPWRTLSFVSLFAFFAIPFFALLLRQFKRNSGLLTLISAIALAGIFLARFIEVAPPLLKLQPGAGFGEIGLPLISAVLIIIGSFGVGVFFFNRVIAQVPIMAIGDDILLKELEQTETH